MIVCSGLSGLAAALVTSSGSAAKSELSNKSRRLAWCSMSRLPSRRLSVFGRRLYYAARTEPGRTPRPSFMLSEAQHMDLTPDGAIGALKACGLDSLPPVAIVLGSGLGAFADEARDSIAISYLDIPGFPLPTVEGHAGRLGVGTIEGQRVALFQGRGHYYERGDANAMRMAIDTFRQ